MDALAIFKALSNPTRLQIMEWLAHPAKYFDEDSYTQQDLGFTSESVSVTSRGDRDLPSR